MSVALHNNVLFTTHVKSDIDRRLFFHLVATPFGRLASRVILEGGRERWRKYMDTSMPQPGVTHASSTHRPLARTSYMTSAFCRRSWEIQGNPGVFSVFYHFCCITLIPILQMRNPKVQGPITCPNNTIKSQSQI